MCGSEGSNPPARGALGLVAPEATGPGRGLGPFAAFVAVAAVGALGVGAGAAVGALDAWALPPGPLPPFFALPGVHAG